MINGQTKNATDRLSEETSEKTRSVSYGALATILISFIIAVVVTLIVIKITGAKPESLTTTGLVGFLFGVALSSASIVLAIAAISLGKVSERIMTARSDESIRLQNEVFLKTTDALQRIESSTGVTEKRIEDIISGRAGAISGRISAMLTEEPGLPGRSKESLEREIRDSVLQEISQVRVLQDSNEKQQKEEEKRQRDIVYKQYKDFQKKVLMSLANYQTTESQKIGNGRYGTTGEDLVDGVFEVDGTRLAACTFSTNSALANMFVKGFPQFLTDISKEISKGTFANAFLVFDSDLPDQSPLTSILNEHMELTKEDIKSRIVVFSGDLDSVLGQLTQAVDQLNREA